MSSNLSGQALGALGSISGVAGAVAGLNAQQERNEIQTKKNELAEQSNQIAMGSQEIQKQKLALQGQQLEHAKLKEANRHDEFKKQMSYNNKTLGVTKEGYNLTNKILDTNSDQLKLLNQTMKTMRKTLGARMDPERVTEAKNTAKAIMNIYNEAGGKINGNK